MQLLQLLDQIIFVWIVGQTIRKVVCSTVLSDSSAGPLCWRFVSQPVISKSDIQSGVRPDSHLVSKLIIQ